MPKTTPKPADQKPTIVRRGKGGDGWWFPDHCREWFNGGCTSALMFDVKFEPVAKPMRCHSGYDSTGEATGVLVETEDLEMHEDAQCSAEVVYDSQARKFHVKGKPDELVTAADFLVLHPNGTAFAGWRTK